MKPLFIFLLACLALAACRQELSTDPDEYTGPVTTVRISFNTAGMKGDVSTRVTDTTTVDDEQIKDIWVLQFQSGNFVRKVYYYDNIDEDAFEVGLRPGESNIYFVANAGSSAFQNNPASETAFKSLAKSITSEASVIYTAATGLSSIPMYGELLTQTVPASGYMEGLSVTLTRMLARVDLVYTVDASVASSFELKKVRVCSVPATAQYYPPQTALFPASPSYSTVTNFEYSADGVVTNAGDTLTFFLPENMRGTGSNTGTDPRLKSGIDYATYIELVGYTKGTQGGDEIAYRVYPGADNLNDYNIVRNTHYSITSNIKGISPSDSRVKKLDRANCYMLLPGQSVLIPVKRANDSALGIQIEDVSSSGWTASLSWETVSGLVTVTTTDDTRSFGMFKVTASSPTANGNALVVVKNASDEVLWSWHIWVTTVDLYTRPLVDGTNVNVVNGNTWMMYNLGGLGINVNYQYTGLYYQWGRKDPFLPATGTSSSWSSAPPALYNYTIYNHPGASALTNNSYEKYYPSTLYSAYLQWSVRYPATFIPAWGGSTATVAAAYTSTGGMSSWGGEAYEPKSVYDPCPRGWRVPSGRKTSSAYTSPWSTWSTSSYFSGTINFSLSWGGANYPFVGLRENSSCIPGGLPNFGYYWSASANAGNANALFMSIDSSLNSANYVRGNALPVRCVQEW